MNDREKIRYINFLMNVKNLGNNRIRNIILRLPEPYDFFNCSPGDLRKIDGIDHSIIRNIFEAKQKLSDYNTNADKLILDAGNKKINILSLTDPDYPENLKRIYDAPVEVSLDFSTSKFSASKPLIFDPFIRGMLWDTAAIFYRMNFLGYYSDTNQRKWVYSKELQMRVNTGESE